MESLIDEAGVSEVRGAAAVGEVDAGTGAPSDTALECVSVVVEIKSLRTPIGEDHLPSLFNDHIIDTPTCESNQPLP